jgi:hypothetical protein
MLRRRCGAVIDEDYVQEHILTGGNVAPLEAPRQLVNRRSAISLGVVASHLTHRFRSGRFCPAFEIADQANAANDRRRAEVCLAGAS